MFINVVGIQDAQVLAIDATLIVPVLALRVHGPATLTLTLTLAFHVPVPVPC